MVVTADGEEESDLPDLFQTCRMFKAKFLLRFQGVHSILTMVNVNKRRRFRGFRDQTGTDE